MNIILTTALSGIITMFAGFILPKSKQLLGLAIVLVIGIIISGLVQLNGCGILLGEYANMIQPNYYGNIFFLVLAVLTGLYFLLNYQNFEKIGNHTGEYLTLIFISMCGMAVLSQYNNLVMFFLGIELLSIPMYILAGVAKDKMKSTEASIKYFLMGSFSTGIMLLGIALIYGATGTFALQNVWKFLPEFEVIYLLGWVLIIFSLCFKVSAAPLHFWTPDVYDGTPTTLTSFMSTLVKGAGFFAFISILAYFPWNSDFAVYFKYLLSFIILLTLVIGNFSAIKQSSVKRMMAYSSIAQAGFMLFVLFDPRSIAAKESLLFYTVSYSLSNFIIFYTLTRTKTEKFEAFNGLAKSQPVLAFSTAVALISLAGIPLTSGFIAKFMALSIGSTESSNMVLIIISLVLAVLSVYYYFKVIIAMYFKDQTTSESRNVGGVETAVLVILAVSIILLGVFPSVFNFLVKVPMW